MSLDRSKIDTEPMDVLMDEAIGLRKEQKLLYEVIYDLEEAHQLTKSFEGSTDRPTMHVIVPGSNGLVSLKVSAQYFRDLLRTHADHIKYDLNEIANEVVRRKRKEFMGEVEDETNDSNN